MIQRQRKIAGGSKKKKTPKKKKEKLATKLRLVFGECKANGFSSDEITEIFSETF